MKKIKAFIKEPGKNPHVSYISDSLENLQKWVGGYIETVTIAQDLIVICNEEGLILDLPFNCQICGANFYGTLLFVGSDGEELDDVGMSWQDFKAAFRPLFTYEEVPA